MKLAIGNKEYEIELYNTPTARKIAEALPYQSKAIVWGGEIYFSIPINTELETNAKEYLDEGQLAYYPPMNAFCIFFGPTPASTDSRPKAADLVNVFGKMKSDISSLSEVNNGDPIKLYIED